jgi:hypothetical protein
MNLLQTFMAECNRQTRAINQEEVEINNSIYFGTFGDPQVQSDFVRQGYDENVIAVFLAPAEQFGTSRAFAGLPLTRKANNAVYLIQSLDTKDPVTLTFLLIDRQPNMRGT